MRTLLKILLAVVVLAAVVLAVALSTDFDSPRLAEAVVSMAAERGGIDLEIDRFGFNLRKGLVLEGVRARSVAAGELLEVRLGRLVLEHRLWPLLKGEVVIDRLLIERPVVEMVSADPRSARQPSGASAAADIDASAAAGTASTADEGSPRLHFEIGEVILRDGRVTSSSAGGAGSTTLEGLNLTLRNIVLDAEIASAILGLSGQGWLEARSLSLGEHRLEDIATSFSVENGRYRLDAFETEAGTAHLRVRDTEIDLAQNPYRYRFEIVADGVEMNRLLGVESGLGSARAEVRANGEGGGPQGAVAEISARLEGGRLPSSTLLARIDRALGTTFDAAAYEALDIEVSLADNVLEIDPFEIVTEIARLRIGGTVVLGDSLDLRIAVGVPRDLFTRQDVSEEILDVLTDGRSWLTVPLRVTGTVENPSFGPDIEAIGEATRYLAEQVRESLRERARSELEGALRRRLGGN